MRYTTTGVWAQLEGQVVNGVFPLRRFLSGSEHAGVYLTESNVEGFLNAALKLIPADQVAVPVQLANWKTATALSHPNLVRLLDSGSCQLGDRQFVFVVMEYAEETLSQILPYRALAADEVREMLLPTLDALRYLHSRDLVQGQLRPSNFLVVNDQLRLASDTIRPAGQTAVPGDRHSLYDPPEADSGISSTAGDIWALGITMVEALTQRPPVWPDERSETPSLPSTLPPSLFDLIRQCLSRNPAHRPTVTGLEAQLKQTPDAPGSPGHQVTARQGAGRRDAGRQDTGHQAAGRRDAGPQDPGRQAAGRRDAGPQDPGRQAAGRQGVAHSAASQRTAGPPATAATTARQSAAGQSAGRQPAPQDTAATVASPYIAADSVTSNNPSESRSIIPVIAVLLAVLVSVWGGMKLFKGRSDAAPGAVASVPADPGAPAGPGAPVAPRAPAGSAPPAGPAEPVDHSPVPSTRNRAVTANIAPAPATNGSAPAGSPAIAARTSPPFRNPLTRDSTSSAPSRSVLHEEIPTVSRSSRDTIHGHIKVAVRVTVDSSGNVAGEAVDNPGPSQYFSRVAADAARKWKFTAAQDEKPQQWLIRFEFGRGDTTAHAVPRP